MNSQLSSFSELSERIKCGEIFLLINEENFVFSCLSCETSFTQIDDYMKHAKCCIIDIKKNNKIKDDFDEVNQYKNEDIDDRFHENVECIIKTEISNENDIDTKSDIVSIMSPAPLAVETVFINENDESEDLFDHPTSENTVSNDDELQKRKTIKEKRKRIRKRKGDPSLVCSICKMQLSTKRTLEKHNAFCRLMLEHSINMSTYTKDGEMTSTQKYDPSNPVAGFSTLTCRFCQKRFKNRRDCVEHECKHTGEKLYKCDICGQSFRLLTLLKSHKKVHEGIKNHKCHLCDAAFTLSTNLQVHIRRHLGEKRYKCRYCEMRFVATTERLQHERSHTGEKPFQCDDCGKFFTTKPILLLHAKTHSGVKTVACPECDKYFYTKKALKKHLVSHSDVKNFKCSNCESQFRTRSCLNTHMKIHLDKREYACTICGKRFNQLPGLYSHIKVHGKVITQPSSPFQI